MHILEVPQILVHGSFSTTHRNVTGGDLQAAHKNCTKPRAPAVYTMTLQLLRVISEALMGSLVLMEVIPLKATHNGVSLCE